MKNERDFLRTDIINHLAKKNNAASYLEIGVGCASNFTGVNISYKAGIDPKWSPSVTHLMTSDEFFSQNKDYFDIIFIDGLHHAEQVYCDIINSLKFLNLGGYIVCHDMAPSREGIQIIPREESENPMRGAWLGDCWKAFVKLRAERDDLVMRTVNTDFGCGIIERNASIKLKVLTQLTWSNYVLHKAEWLNLISSQEFFEIYS